MRGSPSESSALRFGAFKLDLETGDVYKNGTHIKLQPQPFKVLALLASHAGQLVTREQLQQEIWGSETFVDFEKGLNFCVKQIRGALGEDADVPRYIETLPRRGYRFIAPVEVCDHAAGAVRVIPVAAPGTAIGVLPQSRRRLWLIGGPAAAMAGVAALSLWHPWRPRLAFQQRDWVLIASFENRTGERTLDGTLEYALERELSNSQFVNVVPRERIGDALRLMKKPPDTQLDAAVGREICLRDGGVRALLTGRVEKLDTTYVLSTALVEPTRGVDVASFSEEAVGQREIVPALRRVASRVRKKLGEELPLIQQSERQLEKVTTPSLRALQLYSQAMVLVNERKNEQAAGLLEQAVTEDPNFASAHILLAHCYSNLGKEDQAAPHYKRAFGLADTTTDRERYFILGSYYERFAREREKATQAYEVLVHLYPDHYWGVNNLAIAYAYGPIGRYEEAANYAIQRAELRPNDFYSNFGAWNILANFAQEPARARPYLVKARKLVSQENLQAGPFWAIWFELSSAMDDWQLGEVTQVLSEVNRVAQTIDTRPKELREHFASKLGDAYLTLGKLKLAEQVDQNMPDKLGSVALARRDMVALRAWGAKRRTAVGLPVLAIFLARAGLVSQAQKELSAMEKQIQKELTATEKKEMDEIDRGFVKVVQGELALAQGHRAAAIPLLREAIGQIPAYIPSHLLGVESLAGALEQNGEFPQAIQVLEESSRQKGLAGLSAGWLWMRNQFRLAQLYRKAGREDEARKIEDELLKLLAYADSDYPMLLDLNRLQNSVTTHSPN